MNGIKNKISKYFSFFVLILTIVSGFIFYHSVLKIQKSNYYKHHVSIQGFYLMEPQPIKDLNLTDMYGKKFTKDNLKNHWTLLYFGFTHCQVICPNTMAILHDTYQILRSELEIKKLPQIAFISIDPNRDTLSKIRQFVERFGDGFIGLRGDIKTISGLEQQFRIPVKKIEEKMKHANDYNLSHGIDILLINPDKKVQAYFTYPHKPERLAHDYKAIVNKYLKS
jgi:protein SCO1/2